MAREHNKMFVVEITRTETYTHTVRVKAKNELEARWKVMNFDDDNYFEGKWNEIAPDVATAYEAKDATLCDADSLKYIEEVS